MTTYASLQENHDPEEHHGILFHVAEPTRSKWTHIEDLDSFFTRMYKYHQRHGYLCMVLQELFELHEYVFVVFLTTYLFFGVEYNVLFNDTKTKLTFKDVILPPAQMYHNLTSLASFVLLIALVVWILKALMKCYQLILFWDIKQFYNTALDIQDSDLDNTTWSEVQSKIKQAQLEQQMCIHKRELTELDIYHRILRQDNYFVAMVNKKLLPPRIHIPFLGEAVYWSRGLRYNVQGLFFWSPWSPFENPWHLREEYKRQNLRQELASQLGRQILWLAFINLLLAPLILIWQFLITFFSYGELVKREPGQLGIRNWSLFAKLYLRHFNELDHELQARLSRAYRPAAKYLAAFSSPLITITAHHIAFLCGSLFAVLIVYTIIDDGVLRIDHLIVVMTVLGAALPVCRGLIPDDSLVWCPETLLQGVVMHTHYLPPNWRFQAHTAKVKEDFQQLFQYRFVAVLEEILSPVLTPFFLWRWVYPRSLDIVDFFRNFTVSVVGVGDVCSFAQMDIKKHGNPQWQSEVQDQAATNQYTQAEDGKVELSLVHFTTTNPDWEPTPEGRNFVQSVQGEMAAPREILDEDVFASFQNLLDSSSMADFDLQSVMNLRKSMATLRRSSPTSRPPLPKKSVWMSEGPDAYGILDMKKSALILHDRFEQSERGARSLEETTPLLRLSRQ